MQLLPRHHLTRDELKHLIHQLDPRRDDYQIESQETIARLWCFLHGHEFLHMHNDSAEGEGLTYRTRNANPRIATTQHTKDYHDEVLELERVLTIVERNNDGDYFADLLPRKLYPELDTRPIVSEIKYQVQNGGWKNERRYFVATLYAYRFRDVATAKERTVYPHTSYGYGHTRAMAILAAVLENHENSLFWDQMDAEDAARALQTAAD